MEDGFSEFEEAWFEEGEDEQYGWPIEFCLEDEETW